MEHRPLPALNDENRFFWTSGSDGKLRFMRCGSCGYYIHPYGPVCPECLSDDVSPQPVSGRATVKSVTLSHLPAGPEVPVPFAIAIVALEEQGGLNLTTNISGIAAEDVRPGMAVQVTFEPHGEIFIPLFEPAA